MGDATETRVPCSYDTHDRLTAVKRGGETFDRLFQKMLEQYDPEAARQSEPGEAITATR